MRCHFSSNSSTAYFLGSSQYETLASFPTRCAIARTSWGSKMYVCGLPVSSEFTMTQKSPMILSRSVPSGTGFRLLRLFTWMGAHTCPIHAEADNVDSAGIARRGHHVPAELGQLEANIVQADVPDNLRRPFHWGDYITQGTAAAFPRTRSRRL